MTARSYVAACRHQPGRGGAEPKAIGGDKLGHTAPKNCRYCNKPGHRAKKCRKVQHDRERKGEATHLVEAPALLLAAVEEDGVGNNVAPVEVRALAASARGLLHPAAPHEHRLPQAARQEQMQIRDRGLVGGLLSVFGQ